VPVDFLTREQEENFGRYNGDPSPDQLARYFHLDDADLEALSNKRGFHNRFGFALQLGTVRFLGTFVTDFIHMPMVIMEFVAEQLDYPTDGEDLSAHLDRYRINKTRWEHMNEIKQRYGYRDFTDPSEYFRLTRWLYTRVWLTAERPSMLFDLSTARLVNRKVLLPGVTVLARLVARTRDRAAERMCRLLAASVNKAQIKRLESLLMLDATSRKSTLDRLRNGPVRTSGPALLEALERLDEMRAFGFTDVDVSNIPPARLRTLARYAATAWAQTIARMPEQRRIATLVAFVKAYEVVATDDALDVLNLLVTDILKSARSQGEQQRLRTLRDLDAAALLLVEACAVLLDDNCPSSRVRHETFSTIPKERLAHAISTVSVLARSPDDKYYPEMTEQYARVRRFLPRLLEAITFHAAPAGQSILRSLKFLVQLNQSSKPTMEDAPLDVVSKAWHPLVVTEDGSIDRRAYTLCVLERLQDALQRRNIFVEPSDRWGDPRIRLLQGKEWKSVRAKICKTLDLDPDPRRELSSLAAILDNAYRRTAANFPNNANVRVEMRDGVDTLILSPLDKLEEPSTLVELRERVDALLPRVELPEILMEMHLHTGFANEFTHISESGSRAADLALSIFAVLIAEACNTGLEPLVDADVPALTRARLAWIEQNYIRADTITPANACLVAAQNKIQTARLWGGGEVASADGLRFVTPVKTLNAGPNSKYFGVGRGITYYNFTSDQFTGIHGIVTPGTMRDSMVLLAGLLEQQTSLQPQQVMTDTAGASDIVFGLFWLLGFQFSPRLADIQSLRFWRINPEADYRDLNLLSRHRINLELIVRNWEDMLRIAASLKLGTISAADLMGTLLNTKRPSELARAIAELGRIDKTLHLLSFIDNETYRRQILTQLNRGEGRNGLARAVCHGRRGEIRQHYRQGQEDQLGILGLVVNVIVLWNTMYTDAALNHLRANGYPVRSEDVARLSPLGFKHVNFLGRYTFPAPPALRPGQLRPLRSPDADLRP
jgi:TnpA family transposase